MTWRGAGVRSIPDACRQRRRGTNPHTASTEGIPNPTQLTASHMPSPSKALNNPAAQSTPIALGIANTFQKFDCRGLTT